MTCAAVRCSPWSAAFPAPPPPSFASPLCSAVHRYYAAVRLLPSVRARSTANCLFGPACRVSRRVGGFPVLVHVVSRRAQGLRLRGILLALAFTGRFDVAFPLEPQGRHPHMGSRSSISWPTDASVYASAPTSRRSRQDSRSGWFAIPFLQGSCIPCNMPVYPGARPRPTCGINLIVHGISNA